MKNIRNLLFSILFLVLFVFSFAFQPLKQANAVEPSLEYNEFSLEGKSILNDFCEYKTRVAGSDNEAEAANFIKTYLENYASGVVPKNDLSTIDGVQKFKFISPYTGLYTESQNIIFEYKSVNQTKNKVIIACNYDAPSKFDEQKGEYVSYNNDALNASASGVASVLLLAKNLPNYYPAFDIEFVFFGAGELNNAGSEFYTNGLSTEDAKNILCVINVDKIALGQNLYFYIDEIQTSFSKYVSKTTSVWSKPVDLIHLNKTEYVENDLNLGYSHIGLSSDNVKFMKRGITTINFFAGSYDSGIVMGLNEYDGKSVITYTDNDNINFIKENLGENVILENIYKANASIEHLLCDKDFVKNSSNLYQQNSWFYMIFANSKLVALVTIIAFIVILIFAMRVYYKLTIKSYYADVEVEFLSSVVKISGQIDETSQDKNVAKVVGQVLANDIKKDKTLKPEKKKKDE